MGDSDPAEDSARHRFFVAPHEVTAERIRFSPAQQQQLRKVLRLRDGDTVLACPGDGTEIVARLHLEGAQLWGEPLLHRRGSPEPSRAVWLYQSALRGDRFTWLLQKATEIGVQGVVPLIYRYTQQADYQGRLERYQSVVREAAEQCGRTRLPEVRPAISFADAVEQRSAALRLLLDEREDTRSLRAVLEGSTWPEVHLFIGPEGGLSEEERRRSISAGITPISLGARILRSETAGLIGAALVLAQSGDLG